MSETDLAYYERRAEQERAAAKRASDVAAERHRALARSYEAAVNAYRKCGALQAERARARRALQSG